MGLTGDFLLGGISYRVAYANGFCYLKGWGDIQFFQERLVAAQEFGKTYPTCSQS